MSEYTILSALKNVVYNKKVEKLICITNEEWVRSLLLFGVQEYMKKLYGDVTLKKISSRYTFDLFPPRTPQCFVVEEERCGKNEQIFLNNACLIPPSLLLFFGESGEEPPKHAYEWVTISKVKPWERIHHIKEAIRFLLSEMNIPLSDEILEMLAQKTVSHPGSFAQEMERYRAFSFRGTFAREELCAHFAIEEKTSLFDLFDAWLERNAALFFARLSMIEEEGELTPFQIVRFFRSQLEPLLLAEQGTTPLKYKSQERKVERLKALSFLDKCALLRRLIELDIGLRDGSYDERSSPISLFIPFF